jgi:tRNA/tmRNA/rRNA uracil-C5-methylase (TrmA/RlmC/RlmD family)
VNRGQLSGTTLELEVGPPAAGGACVARVGDDPAGRVVFVRHALPGERVRALVTEDRGGSFCRADAVEVLRAADGRVRPPCPHAGPGRCGGCDWQHADAATQRELKTQVVRDQFARLAGIDLADRFTGVEALPGGLLGWRTRNLYAVAPDGRLGLRRHATHEVELIRACPLGVEGVGDHDALRELWPGFTGVEVVQAGDAEQAVLGHKPGRGRQGRGRRPPDRVEQLSGPPSLRHRVAGNDLRTSPGGFWQVHPVAADALVAGLLTYLEPRPGETVLDLYAGAGMLTGALAQAVGADGRVVGLELDRRAVADAGLNLAAIPQAEVRHGRVTLEALRNLGAEVVPDLVVLDPPRAGAGKDVVAGMDELSPRAICYVSCDTATLARDVADLVGRGWRLARLRAIDAFPMTQHVECQALLLPASDRAGT